MKKPISEQQLKQLSLQYLDDSIDSLDASVSNRLKASRQVALQGKSRNYHIPQWTGAFATIMLLVVGVWHFSPKSIDMTDDFLLAEDMIQIEGNQDLLNDLEFYQWLEQQGDLA